MFDSPPPALDLVLVLSEALTIFATALVLVWGVHALVRHYVALKASGTSPSARARAQEAQHPLVTNLSQTMTVLAVVCGGLLVQIGYVATIHGGLMLVVR